MSLRHGLAGECAFTLVWDISVLGHFSPCRILAGGCGGVSRVRSIRVRFTVKLRVRDGCCDG